MIEIVEVTSKQQYRAFFQFPFELYHNCPQWVPPITKEEMDIFNPQFLNTPWLGFFLQRKKERL
jgi:hypothetical protein